MAILRISAVKIETGHRCNASIYNAINSGLFTKPVKIGQRAVGWPDHEVMAICKARVAGWSTENIRELIGKLHAKRLEIQAF